MRMFDAIGHRDHTLTLLLDTREVMSHVEFHGLSSFDFSIEIGDKVIFFVLTDSNPLQGLSVQDTLTFMVKHSQGKEQSVNDVKHCHVQRKNKIPAEWP